MRAGDQLCTRNPADPAATAISRAARPGRPVGERQQRQEGAGRQRDRRRRSVHVVEQIERIGQHHDPGHGARVIHHAAHQPCAGQQVRVHACGNQGRCAQALDDHAESWVERPEIVGQAERTDDGRGARDGQELPVWGRRRDGDRTDGAARDRHAPEIGGGAAVTPVFPRLVEQAVPDREPPHGLGQQRDKDESQDPGREDETRHDHDVTRSGRTASSRAASAIVSSRIPSSERCGDHPVCERSFAVSGTRRCMSSNPESYALS